MYLLDTHIIIWMLYDSSKIPANFKQVINNLNRQGVLNWRKINEMIIEYDNFITEEKSMS